MDLSYKTQIIQNRIWKKKTKQDDLGYRYAHVRDRKQNTKRMQDQFRVSQQNFYER